MSAPKLNRLLVASFAVLALKDHDRASLQSWMIDRLEPVDFTPEGASVHAIREVLDA